MSENNIYKNIILVFCLISIFTISNQTAAESINDDASNLLMETASTLEDALNYLDKSTEINLFSNIKNLQDFTNALQADIQRSRDNKFTVLSSHTLEQLGKFGLGKMPDVVDWLKASGKLPNSFKLFPTFGVEELVVGFSRHAGSGKADIDTITNYLDGLNQAAWATVGYLVGGPEGAKIYQTIAGTGAKLLREATLPIFNKAVLAWSGQRLQLAEQWRTLQERRIYDGLSIQTVTEVYGEKLLKENGLGKKDIQQLNVEAQNLNQTLIQMKKDFSVEKIEAFSQSGDIELGGVFIDPKLIYAGKFEGDVKKKTIESRPSEDALSWTIDIPEEVK